MVTVLRSSRSVPPLAISLYDLIFSILFLYPWRATIAAVRVVLPWAMCPMVPTLTCGLVGDKTCLAMGPSEGIGLPFGGDPGRRQATRLRPGRGVRVSQTRNPRRKFRHRQD